MYRYSYFKIALVGYLVCLSVGCASHSLIGQNQIWTDRIGKSIENKNLVIVSTATASTQKLAKFSAESSALEDLANECSFVPRGTYVQDELTNQKAKDQFAVIVKVVVELQNCEKAKQALQLSDIAAQANLGYTEQILKNQLQLDLRDQSSEKLKPMIRTMIPPMIPREKVERILSSDDSNLIRDDADFFMMRQQIAFLKQSILLSSKDMYPKSLVLSDRMTRVLTQKIEATQNYELKNATLKASSVTWSFAKERITQNLKASEAEQKSNEKIALKKPKKNRRPAKIENVVSSGDHELSK